MKRSSLLYSTLVPEKLIHLVLLVSLFFSVSLSAQPVNDSCFHALDISVPQLAGSVLTYSGHNIGGAPELGSGIFNDCSPGGIFSGFGADVWYRFEAYANVCLDITVSGLSEPEMNVLEGGDCFNGLEILCESGSNGNATGTIAIQAGQHYLLRISGGSQSDQGYFEVSFQGAICPPEIADPVDLCLLEDAIELSPPPGPGNTYQPGQVVEVCYTVSGWTFEATNWFHAIDLDIGAGWDQTSIQPLYDDICNSNSNGFWIFTDFWISCNTGLDFGPGFVFESIQQGECNYGAPLDGDPGNNWGDQGPGCFVANNSPSWKFCWTMTVAECEASENASLDIAITALSDGVSGSWTFDVCGSEVDETVELSADCSEFDCNPMLAFINGIPASCEGEMDGSFEVLPFTNPDDVYNVFLYTLNDVLLDAAYNVTLPYTYPPVLDTGYYGILVELPGAYNMGYCNDGVIDIINIQPAFEVFTFFTSDCNPDSARLRVTTWPYHFDAVYSWNGPNGFTSSLQEPYVTDPGMYYVSVKRGGCIQEDSILVELPDLAIALEIGYWQGVPCANNRMYLYASGVGNNDESYQWIDPLTGNVLNPGHFFSNDTIVWDFGIIDTNFELLLVGVNEFGCSDTISFSAEYYEAPALNFESDILTCDDNAVVVNILDNPALDQLLWLDINQYLNPRLFFGAGPVAGQTLEVPVLLTYNNGCELQDTISIILPGLNITSSDSIACIDIPFTLEASPALNYEWNTGETAQSISYTPTEGGILDFSVTVTDDYGCQRTQDYSIEVANEADAGFTYNLSGDLIMFQPNTPQNDYTSYSWSFGDNSFSSEYAPTHLYSGQDSVVVEFTASTRCGLDTETTTIYFDAPPVTSFTSNVTSGCAPLEVTFNNETQNADVYFWVFEGGTPAASMETNPTVIFSEAGVYDVSLTALNQNGFTTFSETNYITIGTLPSGGFTWSTDFLITQFSADTMGTDSILWDFGDGSTSTELNPTHEFSQNGTYEVTLTLSNECGSVELNESITVEGVQPLAGFSAFGHTSGCAPLTIAFNNLSTDADTYAWAFPGGQPATSTEANPVITYESPGSYSISLTASNDFGSSTFSETSFINVGTTPTGSFSYTVDYLSINFEADVSNASSMLWDFGDGNTSTELAPTHLYAQNGTYEVTLSLTNECGTIEITESITVEEALPVAGFNVSETSGCVPFTVTFDNLSTNADTYAWEFPGGEPATSTASNPTITYSAPGNYNVSLTATNQTGSSAFSETSFINVGTTPTGSFSYTVDYLSINFEADVSNASSMLWDFGDGNTSTELAPTHLYAQNGTYEVTLSLTNECGTIEITESITVEEALPVAGFNVSETSGCVPFTVTFDNLSTDADTYAWEFPGGEPATSTEANPTITYSTPGSYNVSLTATNETGSNVFSETSFINVGTTPAGSFSYTVDYLSINFEADVSNASSMLWDFGDGNTSTELAPTHLYAQNGTYEVTLSLTNECGTIEITESITVEEALPVAGFNVSETSGCVPFTVTFDNLSTNADTYAWEFPGGQPATSTEANPTITYSTPGSYNVSLTATNETGSNVFSETSFINVGTTPAGSFSYTVDFLVVSFSAAVVNANAVQWNFGDGNTSTALEPTHEYTLPGTYEISLELTNECGTIELNDVITVEEQLPPVVGFSTEGETSGCAPLSVTFINESIGAESYEWQFPGGMPSSSSEVNPTIVYDTPGIYNVQLIAYNAAGSSALVNSELIMVNGVPSGSFSYNTDFLTVDFTADIMGATSVHWDFGDGNTSTALEPVHEYTQNGTYDVTLTLINECGTVELTETIMVEEMPPVADFSITGPNSGCIPFTVNFSNESTNADHYFWGFPGGDPSTSMETSPTITYNQPGIYDVFLTVDNQTGSDSYMESGLITVGAPPSGSFIYSADFLTVNFTSNEVGSTAVLWDFGDGNSSSVPDPVHEYTESGIYIVSLSLINACGTTTLTDTLDLMVSNISSATIANHWALYPNPNNGQFWLASASCNGNTIREMALYNSLGEKIMLKTFAYDEQSCLMPVFFDVPAGVYWVYLVDKGGTVYLKKVVVQ